MKCYIAFVCGRCVTTFMISQEDYADMLRQKLKVLCPRCGARMKGSGELFELKEAKK